MTLDDRATRLSKLELIRLLNAVYGVESHVDDIIDRYLAAGEGPGDESVALVETLSAQLKQIADEDEFYGYPGSYDFSERLSSVLSAIDNLLRPQDPQAALSLTETFLELADEAFQRVDDSDGYVGGIFKDATNQWLAIAAELRQRKPDAENWPEKVLTFFDNNDYGVLDDIITNSAALLTKHELNQLAAHFEAEAKAALASPREPGRYNFEAAHACIGIKSVAEALQDMALYEQATLLTSPVPNTLQLASIIDFALAIGELDRAGYWLEQPQWQDDQCRYRSLRYLWLKRKGDTDLLKTELWEDFTQRPHRYTLEPLWQMVSDPEKQQLRQQVENLARDAVGPEDWVNMLLLVGSVNRAEIVLLEQPDQFASVHYGTLLSWVEIFAEEHKPLAQVMCYRALLNDLLDRGYTRAYRHGARYFHKLLALDKVLEDYRGLEDAQAFICGLQTRHWRKRSFWNLADYPNKPPKD
ncbi:DUF6880 family protein [Marinobacter excellens]|uniref:Uncharacterized protein n=1 Tax=Marinobacter excellens LAMA 842 TaxID=1306954 RepID=A0A137SB12_9GAMM|nr:DUF6880 family protein [Marinobacter excellens]KXO09611.1 hypothetical protein J122_2182 [Marinobacter excellens LAMA 842]